MAIRNRELNSRLSNLLRCAEVAPERTHVRAKEIARAVGEAADAMREVFYNFSLDADNSDRCRNLEVAIYEYLLASNRDEETTILVAEGFGEHVDGPAGERVLANAIRDRDAFEALTATRS